MIRHDSEEKFLETSARVRQWYRDHPIPSRQVMRQMLRKRTWRHIFEVAGGEPRRNRRRMMLNLAKRKYHEKEA